ncbi:agmatinase [Rhizobium laguerreae]|uniref:agmatinase n=1 Tax=Rhizobium laguerreae TaxID=1076926 RepID=UPI001FEABD9B|nr:agmatinase [Rhizobium laguerreae]
MRLPQATSLKDLDAAIIGLPSDSGGPYRTGARFAPNAVRAMSVMLRPINPYRRNINIFEELRVADVGDANVVPGYEIESLERIEESVAALVAAGIVPFGIGGDHYITLAELRALAKAHGPIALVHFDSHTDTWDTYCAGKKYSAGTPFRRGVEEQIIDTPCSIQIGMRGSLFQENDISHSIDCGYDVLTTEEALDLGPAALADGIARRVAGKPVFISFDMDFVDPSAAPAVQTPEAGGPTARETLQIIRALHGINLVGCDVVEANPLYDSTGQITALLAATVMAEFLAFLASRRSSSPG